MAHASALDDLVLFDYFVPYSEKHAHLSGEDGTVIVLLGNVWELGHSHVKVRYVYARSKVDVLLALVCVEPVYKFGNFFFSVLWFVFHVIAIL